MRAVVLLLALSLIAVPAVAQDNGTPAMDTPDVDDSFDVMPFVVLVAFAAAAFLLAKYGP